MLGGKKESTETVKSENAMEMQVQKRDGDRDIDAGRGQSQEQRDRNSETTLAAAQPGTRRSAATCVCRPSAHLLEVAGVDVGGGVDGGLLDGARRDKAVEDGDGAGLVVGARGAGTAEGLLADDGAGALVVVVHHARGVAQQVACADERVAVGREDGAGEGVLGGGVDELARLLKLLVGVGVDGDDGAEDLVDHGDRLGVLGLDHGGLDVPSLGVVALATAEHLAALLLGGLDEAHDLLKRVLGDDGAHEVLELVHGADRDLGDLVEQLLLELALPHGLGHVQARERRALLALVLEGGADGLGDGGVDVGRLVDHVEVLAAGLADEARVAAVLVEVVADLLPELAEDVGGAGEVEAGELAVVDGGADDLLGGAGDELDDAVRETGLAEDLVGDVVRVDRHGRGLPDDDVADHGGRADEVTGGDGEEVEGRDGEHKALERAVLGAVPGVGRALGRLGRVQLLDVLCAEAEEVADLCGGVDLGLPHVLALAEHGSGEHLVSVLGRDEVGCLEEDGGAVVPGHGDDGRKGAGTGNGKAQGMMVGGERCRSGDLLAIYGDWRKGEGQTGGLRLRSRGGAVLEIRSWRAGSSDQRGLGRAHGTCTAQLSPSRRQSANFLRAWGSVGNSSDVSQRPGKEAALLSAQSDYSSFIAPVSCLRVTMAEGSSSILGF
ncbi:hypothetical protein L1887_58446 [Cichorium endivia]|nr:hypothetical protein L1887_58446 [Cichorium endivia]